MLADFYIPRLSNDMKIAVQKDHFLYRSLVPSKKRRQFNNNLNYFLLNDKIPVAIRLSRRTTITIITKAK